MRVTALCMLLLLFATSAEGRYRVYHKVVRPSESSGELQALLSSDPSIPRSFPTRATTPATR